jgi:acetyltransferase-like isoleucine patch superfamily enzyme
MARNKISLGKGYKFEKDTEVGYQPQRKIANSSLVIGKNAKVRRGSIVYMGSNIGDNLETGHNVIIREENQIGNDFKIWNNSVIDYGCKIGNNVKIHSNCYVAQFTAIGDGAFLAPGVTIANDMHPGCEFSRECMKGPTIGKGAQIGAGVTILPFIKIGDYALIGAGSVVTKDIPAGAVAYGNPAKARRNIKDLKCVTGLTKKPY